MDLIAEPSLQKRAPQPPGQQEAHQQQKILHNRAPALR
jgi:hypothetical protein